MKKLISFNILLVVFFLLTSVNVFGKNVVKDYFPKNWWTGMKYNNILVSIEGTAISSSNIQISHSSVKLNKVILTKVPSLVFLDLEILANATPGVVPINIYQSGRLQQSINFTLTAKNKNFNTEKLSSSDAIYQVVIDRFINGDSENDQPEGYFEKPDNTSISGIHGGDLVGITSKLDYIQEMGFTAVELSPIYESNQFSHSYYRNEITNHYKLDKRLGSFADLNIFRQNCKASNIKYIQNLVLHESSYIHHIFGKSIIKGWVIPMELNIDYSDKNHYLSDPYNDQDLIPYQYYKDNITTSQLINQDAPISKQYLIQNTIWWIEKCMPDAIKICETHLNKTHFIAELLKEINTNFPSLQIVTDLNTKDQDRLANYSNHIPSNLSVFNYDYPIHHTLRNSFSEYISAEEGVNLLLENLSRDFNYKQPENQVVFIDNSISSRAYNIADKDPGIVQMLYTYILTNRGIPSILYGSEYLLQGSNQRGVDYVRGAFPDKSNMSSNVLKTHKYISDVLNWRLNKPVLQRGNTKHYNPKNGIYAVLRYNSNSDILIVYNNNTSHQKIDLTSISNVSNKYSKAINPISKISYTNLSNVLLDPKSAIILEFE